jgi:ribosome-associated translation inhibitor RaiA
MNMEITQTLQVQTDARGAVPRRAMEHAVEKVRAAARHAPEPVLFARVKLTMGADPAVERPAVAQANLDLNGRLIRAQADAGTLREAVDRMSDRLRARLDRAARNWAAISGGKPVPLTDEWRQGSLARPLPNFRRPPEERAVIRHKSYAPGPQSPDEAAIDLDLLDYDFYLFTERATGEDTVIYRTPDGYRLVLAHARTAQLGPVAESMTVSEQPAPRLTSAAAIGYLESAGQPFLFFVDTETSRGNLIYHRYDGHYGVITPAGT